MLPIGGEKETGNWAVRVGDGRKLANSGSVPRDRLRVGSKKKKFTLLSGRGAGQEIGGGRR